MVECHHVLQTTYWLRRWKNFTMSYRRLTHWDDGRMSPCLTEDLLTGTMDECHHVLQKTYSLGRLTNITMSYKGLSQGRWTNFTMTYRRLTYSLGQWTNFTMYYRRLSHWDNGRMSPCLTEDFLTGTMDEFHHVLQKADLLTAMMDEFHHVLQKTCSLRW
jgi:hypothetical protein